MKREHWGSQLAFVLAAAGSAVGLGNIWKFPYLAGKNGGGAFLLLYVICLIIVGLPLMLVEILIGRTAQKNVVSSFREIKPGSPWFLVGFIGLLAGFLILSFYSVVAGWSLEFLYQTAAGTYWFDGTISEQVRTDKVAAIFGNFISDYHRPLMWHCVFMTLCIVVVACGVKNGIEFWSKILMPMLFGLVLILIARVYFLEGSGGGYAFLFSVNWEAIWNPKVVLDAMGQAFFSLSLGMGAMITYGSYLDPERSLPRSALFVVIADTAVALLAGLAIFPAVFAFKLAPSAGPGLVFSTLPIVFTKMAGGRIFGTLFFASLLIAALTSAISLLEVVVAYFNEEYKMGRVKTTVVLAIIIGLFGIPSALSFVTPSEACPLGMAQMKIPFPGGAKNFFDLVDHLASNLCLPLGGLLMCIFVGWSWGKDKVMKATSQGAEWFATHPLGTIWFNLVRFVAPLIVTLVFIYSFKIISFTNEGTLVFFQGWF